MPKLFVTVRLVREDDPVDVKFASYTLGKLLELLKEDERYCPCAVYDYSEGGCFTPGTPLTKIEEMRRAAERFVIDTIKRFFSENRSSDFTFLMSEQTEDTNRKYVSVFAIPRQRYVSRLVKQNINIRLHIVEKPWTNIVKVTICGEVDPAQQVITIYPPLPRELIPKIIDKLAEINVYRPNIVVLTEIEL